MNCETLERSEVADESTKTGVKRSDLGTFRIFHVLNTNAQGPQAYRYLTKPRKFTNGLPRYSRPLSSLHYM